MKGLPLSLGLLAAALLIDQGFAPQERPRARSSWARADTDTVQVSTVVVSGDSSYGFLEGSRSVQVIVGNVRGLHDSTQLFAGWARRYVDTDQLLFVHDVVVIDGQDTLKADSTYYDGSKKHGRAAGNVWFTDGEVTIHAPQGKYFVDAKRAEFHHGLTLADSVATVTGAVGTFWTNEDRAEVAGDVTYEAKNTQLESDSLTYLRAIRVATATGSVVLERIGGDEDATERSLLFCHWVRMDEESGGIKARGRPLMIRLRQDSTGIDTLVVEADQVETQEADTLQWLTANGDVRYRARELAAVADSVRWTEYESSASDGAAADSASSDVSEVVLHGGPVVWTEGAQITGDSMRIVLKSQEVDSMFVTGEAFVAREDTVLHRINQAKGRMLVAWFGESEERTFVLRPNAEVIVFRRSEEDGPDGALQISGDEAILVLVGDEPQEFSFGEHQGTYFPEDVLEMPLQLQGFQWMPERRPAMGMLLGDPRVEAWMRQRGGL